MGLQGLKMGWVPVQTMGRVQEKPNRFGWAYKEGVRPFLFILSINFSLFILKLSLLSLFSLFFSDARREFRPRFGAAARQPTVVGGAAAAVKALFFYSFFFFALSYPPIFLHFSNLKNQRK